VTIFSDPVVLPWAREEALPQYATSASPLQGATRMSADIALVAYGELVTVPWSGGMYGRTGAIPNLAAVRYTDDGPVVGPVKTLPVIDAPHFIEAVMPGGENEAFLLTVIMTPYQGAAPTEQRLYRITVNPATLGLTVALVSALPSSGQYSYAGSWAVSWPEQRLAIIATLNSPTNTGMNERSLWLVNLDTGAIVTHRALPLAYGTTGIYPIALAFHPEKQEVLVIGDRLTGGYDRPTVFTSPITPTDIGVWTRVQIPLPATKPAPYNDDLWSDGWSAVPVSSTGWQIVGILSGDGDRSYVSGQTWWGSQIVRNYSFTSPNSIAELPVPVSLNGKYYRSEARSQDAEFRDGLMTVAIAELNDRTEILPGTGVGGVSHIEMSADRTTPVSSQVLPQSANYIFENGWVDAVALGSGRYIYLVGAVALTKPFSTEYGSFEYVVYAGGPNQTPPLVPGIKGVEPDENRRAFRRVN